MTITELIKAGEIAATANATPDDARAAWQAFTGEDKADLAYDDVAWQAFLFGYLSAVASTQK